VKGRGEGSFYYSWMAILLNGFSALSANATDVLPVGVRAAAFVFGSSEGIRDGFNDAGRVQSLSYDINRSVTLQELAEEEPKLKTLQNALNSLGSEEFGDSLLVADIYADISVNQRQYVSALLWGVTNKITLGMQIPYIRRDTKASFKVSTVNNAAEIQKMIGEIPQISDGLAQLAATNIDTARFSESIFTENGYKIPSSFSIGGMGNIEFEGRYGYIQNSFLKFTLKSGMKVPTAQHKIDLRNILDRELDDPHYSYKLTSAHDFKLIPNVLALNTSVTGVFRRPYKKLTGVAKSADQILPNLNDPEQVVTVNYYKGVMLDAQVGLVLDVYKGAFSLGTNYVYNKNPKLMVYGPGDLDYSPLTKNTESVSHVVEFSAELSSIPLFLSGKMPLPGKFVLTWSQPVAGKNTLFTPYGRMDMIMLF